MSEYVKIPAVVMRGGTSKGVYLMAEHLPADPVLRDQVILAIFGSPDARQIDGLGGADPLTSKVAVIARSKRPNMDVDYTFGYVGITAAAIDYEGNCGNISTGVGPFAIQQGLVPVQEPITKVRIYNTNTRKVIEAEVPVRDGEVVTRERARSMASPEPEPGSCSISWIPRAREPAGCCRRATWLTSWY